MRALCVKCGGYLAEAQRAAGYHVNCAPDPAFGGGGRNGGDEEAEALRAELTDVILWANSRHDRNNQKLLGPSDLGATCDRRIAFGVAATPAINEFTDPWPAIMGTAIHAWLERAFSDRNTFQRSREWVPEMTVEPDPLIRGHLDLYRPATRMVIDWKSLGTTKMREWAAQGPPDAHITQVQLYAKGLIGQGFPVERVALVGVPRAGWLKDMIVKTYPYDADVAQRAVDRMYAIAEKVMDLEADKHPERMLGIPATPVRGECQWCDWFDVKGFGAGCPGGE